MKFKNKIKKYPWTVETCIQEKLSTLFGKNIKVSSSDKLEENLGFQVEKHWIYSIVMCFQLIFVEHNKLWY